MMLLAAGLISFSWELGLFVVLCISLILVTLRFVLGPTAFDRVASFEAFTLALLSLVAVWGLSIDSVWFFDAILVLSLVGFLSTVAIAQFIERGTIGDD